MSTREPRGEASHQPPDGANALEPEHASAVEQQPPPAGEPPFGETLRLNASGEPVQAASMRCAAVAFAKQHAVARPDDVALAVGEAIANVVEHAYRDRAAGPLHVTGFIDPECVHLTVADEGTGLRPHADHPGLGLGLPIIARASDHFEVSDHPPTGTQVSMDFLRAARPDDDDAAVANDDEELLRQTREQLAAAIHDGASLGDVQARIDGTALGTDDRDALWLYAWATVELAQRHGAPNGRLP